MKYLTLSLLVQCNQTCSDTGDIHWPNVNVLDNIKTYSSDMSNSYNLCLRCTTGGVKPFQDKSFGFLTKQQAKKGNLENSK